MDIQKEIEKYLSCILCKKKFSKNNKPIIMFCSHNICENCKLKKRKQVSCPICGKVFSKREIKKFPINYSILENKLLSIQDEKNQKESKITADNIVNIIENISAPQPCFKTDDSKNKDSQMSESDTINETDKILISKIKVENKVEDIINQRDSLIKETFSLIDNLKKSFQNYSENFFDSMIEIFKNSPDFFINDLNICQLLEESGIINYGDYKKLEKFLEIIKDVDKTKAKNCSSFEDIYELIKENNKDITYENFISLFFFFNKIFELKIKKIPKIIEEQSKLYKNDKENHSNLIHLLINMAQKFEMKLSDIFYDITIYKSCHFIYDIKKNENMKKALNGFISKNEQFLENYNNILLYYEPIEQKFSIEIIKIKELKDEQIIDSYIILNQLLFILTDKQFYMYEIIKGKYSCFDTIPNQEIEKNTKIFKYDTSILKISSNYFESINLREDFTKNEWRTMSLYENTPGIIKQPYPVCHSSDFIYVLDKENKKIDNIYLYHEESDFWEKKELKLEIKPDEDVKEKEKEKTTKDSTNKEKITKKDSNNCVVKEEKTTIKENNYLNNQEKNTIKFVNNYVTNPEKTTIKDSNNNASNKEKITISDSYNNITIKGYEKEELIVLKQLYLEDYFFFNKCFACVFGGRHPVTKKFNKNVYSLDPIKGIIKKIINFDEFITDEMVILELNVSVLNKFVDFLFIYHMINDSNNLKIIIIRKEIIENDISLNSKLEVVLNKNICNIID